MLLFLNVYIDKNHEKTLRKRQKKNNWRIIRQF